MFFVVSGSIGVAFANGRNLFKNNNKTINKLRQPTLVFLTAYTVEFLFYILFGRKLDLRME